MKTAFHRSSRTMVISLAPVIATSPACSLNTTSRPAQLSALSAASILRAGEIEDRGPEIEQLTLFADPSPARKTPGRPKQHRHADDGLIHRPFLAEPMFAEIIAMIGHEDDDAIVEIAAVLQGFQQPANLFVDHADVRVIVSAQ